jgi:hypothetical protein
MRSLILCIGCLKLNIAALLVLQIQFIFLTATDVPVTSRYCNLSFVL